MNMKLAHMTRVALIFPRVDEIGTAHRGKLKKIVGSHLKSNFVNVLLAIRDASQQIIETGGPTSFGANLVDNLTLVILSPSPCDEQKAMPKIRRSCLHRYVYNIVK